MTSSRVLAVVLGWSLSALAGATPQPPRANSQQGKAGKPKKPATPTAKSG